MKKITIINNVQSIPKQIRQLSLLKEDGILTENEFNTKKAQLLEKL